MSPIPASVKNVQKAAELPVGLLERSAGLIFSNIRDYGVLTDLLSFG